MEVLKFKQFTKLLSFQRRRNLIDRGSSFVGMKTCIQNIFILVTIFVSFSMSAQKALAPEDKIYNVVDVFVSNPTSEGIQKLKQFETDFWKNSKPKSKAELLAIVVLNCNRGYYENKFGQTSDAISSYEKAWQLFQKYKLKDYDITEFCLKPLGNLYTIIGDYDNAENTIKQYYFIATMDKNNPEASRQKQAAILNLSNVYQCSGRHNLAIDLLEKIIQTEKLSNLQKGILFNNLGNNYLLISKGFQKNPSVFGKAERSFLSAISVLKKEKNQSETLSNAYRNLASLELDRNNIKSATSYFEKAKLEFAKIPNQEPRKKAQLYFEEASILFKQGKIVESTAMLSEIFKALIPNYSSQKSLLPKKNTLYAETILLDAIDLQAAIYLVQNQPKKALESYALSFHIEELLQSLLVYENSKIITQVRNRNRTEKCITIYDFLFEKEHNITYIESAFLLAEKTKSVVLKKSLNEIKNQSREEKLILEQLQNWNTTIVKEQQKGDSADISKINEAIKKQNELMLLLKSKAAKNPEKSKELDLKSLFEKLEKDNSILVEYFSGSEKMYVFTLVNHKIKLENFSNIDVVMPQIIRFIDFFKDANTITNNISGYNRTGNQVYKMLKLPTKSAYKNLIIIPDGVLNFLSFEALITQESTTTNFAKMHYLLNDFRVGYNNSASFYLSFDKLRPTKNNKKTVLGLFPVFAKTNYELTFSKDEMQTIMDNFDGMYFENSNATFDNFKQNAPNYSILHLSTHASSGDAETPASIKFYDQEILYSELYNLNINPDLVVLSACETGIGKLYKSEGAMSIARGFQLAGAQNLLFSLWKVNDYTTSVFMEKFYKSIKKGSSYLDANHQAKLDYLADKNIPNAKKSPYYWSAFVYYGTFEVEKENPNYMLYGIGTLLLIGLFLLYKRYRK